MKRSCYALTWLLGSIACGLLVVGSARGQIPPTAPALDEAAPSEADCPVLSSRDSSLPAVAGGDRPASPDWKIGPLGYLPYDDEYNCDIPSENPLGLLEPAISALVVQQALEDDLRYLSLSSDTSIEALPFRVLGFGALEIGALEDTAAEDQGDLQVMDFNEVTVDGRMSSVGLLRELAKSLVSCGSWLQDTADALEQTTVEAAE